MVHGQHIKFIAESILTEQVISSDAVQQPHLDIIYAYLCVQEAVDFVEGNGRFGLSLTGIDTSAVLLCIGQFEMHDIELFSGSGDARNTPPRNQDSVPDRTEERRQGEGSEESNTQETATSPERRPGVTRTGRDGWLKRACRAPED